MDLIALHASADALEEVAEEYIFKRLSPLETAEYEEHLLTCGRCRKALEEADEFITLFRSAVACSPNGHYPRLT